MKKLLSPLISIIPFTLFGQQAGQAPVQITVTDTVLRAAGEMQPLGNNNFGDAGGEKAANGNLIRLSGFEPAYMANFYRVIESGHDEKGYWVTLDGPGTSNFSLYNTGLYSGGRMRAYRFLDAKGELLPYKTADNVKGGKILDATNVAEFKPLFDGHVLPKGSPGLPKGGWLADSPDSFSDWKKLPDEEKEAYMKNWRVYYDQPVELLTDDVVIFQQKFAWPDEEDFHPRTRGKGAKSQWSTLVGGFRHVPLPAGAPAAMGGGEGAGELTPDPVTGDAQIFFKIFGGTGRKDSSYYGSLDKGVTYRYEAWAKIEGGDKGDVHLGFGGMNKQDGYLTGYFGQQIGKDFDVTDQWKKIGYTFTAPPTPEDGGIGGAVIRYKGPGKLLIDNVKLQPVYKPGDEDKPFVVYRPQFDAMVAAQPPTGRKGALRIWTLLDMPSIESFLQWDGPCGVKLGTDLATTATGMTLPKALTLAEATGDSPETRMVPWIITQVTQDEKDYLGLVEYLAAPYDPAKDTPASKPLAYLRTQQRGNNRPWTDDFREIIIEIGNENWHNRMITDWIGMGRFGTVHQSGREMGVFQKYLIGLMRQSPYWPEKKISFSFGGNYNAGVNEDGSVSGYAQEAVQVGGGTADYQSHATYIGPKWETGDASQATIDDDGLQKTLFAYRPTTEQNWKSQEEANKQLNKLGFNTKITAYESGPSGFGFRAESEEQEAAGEYYGKSTAMGTAMLDAWLDAWAKGWTYQCYLSFGQGQWWNAFTGKASGFRPSPGWLMQTVINRTMANRDMLEVSIEGSPTKEFVEVTKKAKKGKKGAGKNADANQAAAKKAPEKIIDVPVIQAHAVGGDGDYTVAVSNLDLENAIPAQIHLPIKAASKITLYTLTGSPRDTNIDALKVEIEKRELPAKDLANGTFSVSLAAGMPAVFVFEK